MVAIYSKMADVKFNCWDRVWILACGNFTDLRRLLLLLLSSFLFLYILQSAWHPRHFKIISSIHFMKPKSNIAEWRKFQIIYNRESTKIAPSTREFMKPSNWNDKGQSWTWSTDLHQSYQVTYFISCFLLFKTCFSNWLFSSQRLDLNIRPKKMLTYLI